MIGQSGELGIIATAGVNVSDDGGHPELESVMLMSCSTPLSDLAGCKFALCWHRRLFASTSMLRT